jgi:hypothetical protein
MPAHIALVSRFKRLQNGNVNCEYYFKKSTPRRRRIYSYFKTKKVKRIDNDKYLKILTKFYFRQLGKLLVE